MFKIKIVLDDTEPIIVEILARDLVRLEESDPTFAKERAALAAAVNAGRIKQEDAGAESMTMTRLYTLAFAALSRQKRKGRIDIEIPATLDDFIDSADVETGDEDSSGADPTVPEPNTG